MVDTFSWEIVSLRELNPEKELRYELKATSVAGINGMCVCLFKKLKLLKF